MPHIIPNDVLAVTPRTSARIDRAVTIISGCEAPALASASLAESALAAEPPFWLTGPCPSWCYETHRDSDDPQERDHWAKAEVVDLSLCCVDHGGELVTGGEILVGARQHYRACAPDVLLTVPRVKLGRVEGEQDVRLTLAEARALRDGLSATLSALDEDEKGTREVSTPGGVPAVPGACAPWCAQHSTHGDACFSRELALNVRESSTGAMREMRFMLALADDDASINVLRDGADALELDPAHVEAFAHALLAMAAAYHGDRDAAQLHRNAAGTGVSR